MPTRREILAAAPLLTLASRGATRRPNVVLFMTDDHGAWANGCYGCRDIRTPNIDRLADGGVRLTSAYACTPVCSPSRMTYLTGEIPSQHGVQEWPSELYDLEADPGEKKNLIADPAYREALASLRKEMAGFFRKFGAPPIEQWRSTTRQHLTVYHSMQ